MTALPSRRPTARRASSPSSPFAMPPSSSTRRQSPRPRGPRPPGRRRPQPEDEADAIGWTAREVSDALDVLRAGVLRSVKRARGAARGRRGRLERPHGLTPVIAGSMPACPERQPRSSSQSSPRPATPHRLPSDETHAGPRPASLPPRRRAKPTPGTRPPARGASGTPHPSAPEGADGTIVLANEFARGGTA